MHSNLVTHFLREVGKSVCVCVCVCVCVGGKGGNCRWMDRDINGDEWLEETGQRPV